MNAYGSQCWTTVGLILCLYLIDRKKLIGTYPLLSNADGITADLENLLKE
jgi:hypothetical protein